MLIDVDKHHQKCFLCYGALGIYISNYLSIIPKNFMIMGLFFSATYIVHTDESTRLSTHLPTYLLM